MTSEAKPEIRIHNYVVVFLDLLGQKERLAEFSKLIPHKGLTPELQSAIQDTYGATFKLRETIRSYFEGHELHKVDPKILEGLTDTQRGLFDKMVSSKIHLQYMGDAIVLYSRLTNKYGELNLRSILMMLGNCALRLLLQLGEGNPIRGAIEIGVAMDWEEFGIYGSAFYSAYSLESSVAKYPRVLIGDELLKFLQAWEKDKGVDPPTTVNKEVARRCLSVICEDIDGRAMLDFLSPDLPNIFGSSADNAEFKMLGKSVKEGFNFVNSEYSRFVSEKNSELAFRYALLRDYYISRMGAWDEGT
ncbi:MAG: hypothetical protein KAR47_20005 [Planctomycetes bacterium]|nr:hypothetical protein [Planctomycetota bacterium]